jgi:hypothetical protein
MSQPAPDFPQIDRTAIEVTTHAEAGQEDRKFWLAQTPLERLRHLEALRELNYGPEVLNQRLQRVLELLERPRR